MSIYNYSGARVVNADPDRVSKASLSFSGCGFLCIYHAGVCAAVKEYAPQLLQNRICGASAGSIIAAGIVCNVCISQATSLFLNVVSEVPLIHFMEKKIISICASSGVKHSGTASPGDQQSGTASPGDQQSGTASPNQHSYAASPGGQQSGTASPNQHSYAASSGGQQSGAASSGGQQSGIASARSYTFGALNRDFDLMKLVRTKLNVILPSNAHELCTGRLRISVTRLSDMENVILSEFNTKDELIDAICCSCFIPVYGGFVYPTFRGEIYIDGGASDNQPVVDVNTITVSPFSGESDICPTDLESSSLFEWNFAGTSIRLTTNNLYRAAVCLFPPSTEECAAMCRNGFKDALKFLISNGFVSNAVCLSVEADLSADLNQINEVAASAASVNYKMYQGRLRPSQKSSPNLLRTARLAANTKTEQKETERTDSFFNADSSQLPHSMQSAFDEAMKKDGFLNYLRSFRVVKLAQFMTLPVTASVQLFKFCQCLSFWLAARITKRIMDDWCSMHVKHIINFILNEVHLQEAKVSARFSQHLAVTEFEFSGIGQRPTVREQILDITLSPEAIKEQETLQNMDRLLFKKTASPSILVDKRSDISSAVSSVNTVERSMLESDDTLSQIIEHTTEYDAALAFYYIASGNKLRVCEIFGVGHSEKRHPCHSTHNN